MTRVIVKRVVAVIQDTAEAKASEEDVTKAVQEARSYDLTSGPVVDTGQVVSVTIAEIDGDDDSIYGDYADAATEMTVLTPDGRPLTGRQVKVTEKKGWFHVEVNADNGAGDWTQLGSFLNRDVAVAVAQTWKNGQLPSSAG